jgi:ankyrin repeat protein
VLHEAALHDRVALLEHLTSLSTTADSLRQWEELADQRDHSGRTPLMIACERHNVDMVRLLRRLQVSPGGVERAANLSDALTLCLGLGNNGDLVALFPATLRGDGAATS